MREGDGELSRLGTRTVILMRHASAAHPGGTRDIDRPLTDGGRRDAAGAGSWLTAHWPAVDRTLCSPSVRTRQTAAAMAIDAPLLLAPDLYEAGSDEVLDAVRDTDDAVRTLLIVGHAPGVPGAARELVGPDSEPAGARELERRFPTAALAVLTFSGAWADLEAGSARLVDFHLPET